MSGNDRYSSHDSDSGYPTSISSGLWSQRASVKPSAGSMNYDGSDEYATAKERLLDDLRDHRNPDVHLRSPPAPTVPMVSFTEPRKSSKPRTRYSVRLDIDILDINDLPEDFIAKNSIFPEALGDRHDLLITHELEVSNNGLGWALAWMNPSIRNRPDLIACAVKCWRKENASVVISKVGRQERLAASMLIDMSNEANIQPAERPVIEMGRSAEPYSVAGVQSGGDLKVVSKELQPSVQDRLLSALCLESIRLLEAVVEDLDQVPDVLSTQPQQRSNEAKRCARHLHALRLWAHGLHAESGGLDSLLERACDVRHSTLAVLNSVCSLLNQKWMNKFPPVSDKRLIRFLLSKAESLLIRASECLRQANYDEQDCNIEGDPGDELGLSKAAERVDEEIKEEAASDEGEYADEAIKPEVASEEEDVDDDLEDLETYVQCLVDLTTVIKRPALDDIVQDSEDSEGNSSSRDTRVQAISSAECSGNVTPRAQIRVDEGAQTQRSANGEITSDEVIFGTIPDSVLIQPPTPPAEEPVGTSDSQEMPEDRGSHGQDLEFVSLHEALPPPNKGVQPGEAPAAPRDDVPATTLGTMGPPTMSAEEMRSLRLRRFENVSAGSNR